MRTFQMLHGSDLPTDTGKYGCTWMARSWRASFSLSVRKAPRRRPKRWRSGARQRCHRRRCPLRTHRSSRSRSCIPGPLCRGARTRCADVAIARVPPRSWSNQPRYTRRREAGMGADAARDGGQPGQPARRHSAGGCVIRTAAAGRSRDGFTPVAVVETPRADAEALFGHVVDLYGQGRYAEAVPYCEEAMAAAPHAAQLPAECAKVYEAAGQPDTRRYFASARRRSLPERCNRANGGARPIHTAVQPEVLPVETARTAAAGSARPTHRTASAGGRAGSRERVPEEGP